MTQKLQPLQGDSNPASERHWLYGFNAFALVIVGLAVLVLILYMCNTSAARKYTRWDWTGNGANSLSGSTIKMLHEVDTKGDNYTLITLFTPPTDQDKEDKTSTQTAQQRQQILDLLRQYAKNSPHIKVEDMGEAPRDEIEKRIRDTYKGDFEPYRKAVEQFDPVAKKLEDFLTAEGPKISAFAQQPGATPEAIQDAAQFGAKLAEIPSDIRSLTRDIRQESDATLPAWNTLTSKISDRMSDVRALLDTLSDPAKLKALGAPDSLISYFTQNQAAYKSMSATLKDYTDSIAKLPPLKTQDVLNGLDKDTVVVLGDHAAKVIPPDKIYSASQASGGGRPAQIFNGEQAISSALFAMANPTKIKIVFVTSTAQHLLADSFSDLQDTLNDNNFDVSEWSPPAAPTPDNPAPPTSAPPAEGKGVVWVVFTPDAPDPQTAMFMPPPDARPVDDAVRKHMSEGGQVLFLADPSTAGTFAYDDLVKPFGINVQAKYTVWMNQQGRDQNSGEVVSSPIPYADIHRFEKHEITTPIQSLRTIFGPAPTAAGGAGGYATVVGLQKPLPTGIDATILVNTPASGDYWGEADPPGMGTPKFDAGTDLAAPLPLAAVSIKNKGQKDTEQRIAVIGAKMLGNNYFNRVVPVQVGNDVYAVRQFPGNSEFMKNTILWLAGYENMIAVSAKADPAARIGDVSPGMLGFIRVGLVALFPLGVLFLGGVIYFVRRR